MAGDIESTALAPPSDPDPPVATAPPAHRTGWAGVRASLHRLAGHPPSQPHGFTSQAFVDDRVTQPLPVDHLAWSFGSWRATTFQIAAFHAILLYAIFTSFIYAATVWIAFGFLYIVLFKVFPKVKKGTGDFGRNLLGHINLSLKIVVLRTFSAVYEATGASEVWDLFWQLYFIHAIRRDNFSQNYLEAWRQKCSEQDAAHFILIFVDNSSMIQVPCVSPADPGISDKQLLKHLGFFYRFCRTRGGLVQALLPRSLLRVDIVKLVNGHVAGDRVSTLQLGYIGHRQIQYLENPSSLEKARSFIDQLDRQGVFQRQTPADGRPQESDSEAVLTQGGTATLRSDSSSSPREDPSRSKSAETAVGDLQPTPMALNFVLHWNTPLASIIILTPTLVSILVCGLWPVVAVLQYGADVQDSVQTGSTLAAYIVTTGTFLIALVTLLDSATSAQESRND